MTQPQDGAAVAVLSAHTQFLEKQLTELNRSTADGFKQLTEKLDRVNEVHAEVRVLIERIDNSSTNVRRAHERIDSHDRELAAITQTKNRWRGAFIGAQALSALMLSLCVYVANGYVAEIRDISDRLYRLERGLSHPPAIEVQR